MNNIFSFLIICSILLTGCSATSSRYTQRDKTPEKDFSLRYSQSAEPDTSYTGELPEDPGEEIEPSPEDDAIDITEVMTRFSDQKNENITIEHSTAKEKTLMEIIKYLNTPYKFGGNSKNGIDCSAFTQTVFNNAVSYNLFRSAREQFKQGLSVDKTELKFGDLVFFNTRRRVKPGHVGIYIGDNLFAHASSKHGVIVSSLDHAYYSKTYMGARRMEPEIF